MLTILRRSSVAQSISSSLLSRRPIGVFISTDALESRPGKPRRHGWLYVRLVVSGKSLASIKHILRKSQTRKWNSYITKECVYSTKWMRTLCESHKSGAKIIFKGPALFVSRSLGAKATELYEAHRDLVLTALKTNHPVLIESRKARDETKNAFFELLGY